ncbi:MAG: hypothetical protein N3G79_07075, partial [Sulfolobales archaeon]|nr:hypothetical protein [Sulfolobales archaeon]
MQKRIEVKYRPSEDNTVKFYYADIGRISHGRPSLRLWISSKLVQRDTEGNEFIEFPVRGRIIRTEKGTLVLKPSNDHITHYLFVKCGFRGGSAIEIEKPDNAEVFCFSEFESPQGSLGVSTGALVTIPRGEQLIYRWRRSGRLYG